MAYRTPPLLTPFAILSIVLALGATNVAVKETYTLVFQLETNRKMLQDAEFTLYCLQTFCSCSLKSNRKSLKFKPPEKGGFLIIIVIFQ